MIRAAYKRVYMCGLNKIKHLHMCFDSPNIIEQIPDAHARAPHFRKPHSQECTPMPGHKVRSVVRRGKKSRQIVA